MQNGMPLLENPQDAPGRRLGPLPCLCYGLAVDETLTIRLGSELARALEEAARQAGLSKGELARQALADRLHKSGALSVMRKHFGSMRGPKDLSVNRAYRKQWTRKRA